jgi:hypothetical protein
MSAQTASAFINLCDDISLGPECNNAAGVGSFRWEAVMNRLAVPSCVTVAGLSN